MRVAYSGVVYVPLAELEQAERERDEEHELNRKLLFDTSERERQAEARFAAVPALVEALREAHDYACAWPIGIDDEPQEQRGGPRDTIIRNIASALAAYEQAQEQR